MAKKRPNNPDNHAGNSDDKNTPLQDVGTPPDDQPPVEAQVWQIKSRDDQPFVRQGILFGKDWQEVDVSGFSEEDKQILLDEPALEIVP